MKAFIGFLTLPAGDAMVVVGEKLAELFCFVLRQLWALLRLFMRLWWRWVAVHFAALLVITPFDFINDTTSVWGWCDDFVVITLGLALFSRRNNTARS